MSDLKLFKVVVRDVTIKIYEVNAYDTDEAEALVSEGGIDSVAIGDGGEWEVVSVTEILKCAECGEYIDRKHDGYGHIPGKGYFCVDCWADLHITKPDLKKAAWEQERREGKTNKTYYSWLTDKLEAQAQLLRVGGGANGRKRGLRNVL